MASLLDLDPTLVSLPPRTAAPLAWRTRTAVLCQHVPSGRWQPPEWHGGLGHLLVSGTLMLRFAVGDRRSTELFASGDVIPAGAWGLPVEELSWTALSDCVLARLDDGFIQRSALVPGLSAALFARSRAVIGRLSYRLTIANCTRLEQALLLLFELFAERWGHVSPAGTHVPLPLTHSVLAELVGAQRPSVTTALSRLAASGRLRRVPDGWILQQPPAAAIEQAPAPEAHAAGG